MLCAIYDCGRMKKATVSLKPIVYFHFYELENQNRFAIWQIAQTH